MPDEVLGVPRNRADSVAALTPSSVLWSAGYRIGSTASANFQRGLDPAIGDRVDRYNGCRSRVFSMGQRRQRSERRPGRISPQVKIG